MLVTQTEKGDSVVLERLFPSSPIKIIKLLGFSSFNKEQDYNKRYTAAKRPFMKGWQQRDKPGLSASESDSWIREGGWTGLVIPNDYIVLDIDDQLEGELIYKALRKDQLNFHAIKTVNGYQFIFKDNGRIKIQNAAVLMACGSVGDYRLSDKGQIVLPSINTKGREWIKIAEGELSELPIFFDKLKILNKEDRPFPVPLNEGGRNNALYKHTCRLVEFGYSADEIHEIVSFTNKHLLIPQLEHREFIATFNSALNQKPSGKNYGEPPVKNVPQYTSPKESKFNLTEMGNAERLVHKNGQNLRFCIEFEEWLLWNGSTWIEDKKRQIERIAIKTFREMYGEASKEEDMDRRSQIVKWAQSSEKSSVFLNSIARAQAMLPLSQDELNKDGYLLNCKNGVVNLRTGELQSHERNLLMTKNTHISYDASATCPTWIAFLESIMKDEKDEVKHELINFLQKAIGYTLTGDTSEQVAFFLWGTGRNGKSTFINIVKEILGDYGKQTNSDTFTSKMNDNGINNDVARLYGARFVSAVESEDSQKLSESLIKQLTGGEPITARFLRKEFFEFTPEFKIFFTTNHKPIVKGDDEGIWRRIRLVPFTHTVPKENVDKHLPEKLRAELPGILRWAVEGCMKWQQEGLGEPEEVKAATDEYKEEMDLLSNFLDECCVIMPAAKVVVSEIHKVYMKWAEENGEYPMKQRAFSSRLQMRGFSKRKSTGNRTFFFGIGLIADYNDELPNSYLVTQSDPFSSKAPIEKNFETNLETASLSVTFDTKSNSRVIEEEI
ncbi:phage/plasmid primase, P4 family [Robertmurraya massiliosenegalensis]|uniref:phage/plasmid primase, P4 family n=1 Tax=Robertmurraya TaxID=2837507 RepID=UPI0039A6BA82